MADKSTQISITGKLTYSDEITISQATQIIAFLNSEEDHAVALEAPLLGSSAKPQNSTAKKVESAREALDISGATKNPEKIVALGAYVLQDGGDTFKVEDVKGHFRRAREVAPANFSRDLSIAIASGWIAEDAPGEYYLTNKVAGVLDGGYSWPKTSAAGRSRAASKSSGGAKTKTKTAKTKPDSLADIDVFDSTMEGYPAYAQLKTEKDRLLWAALYMRDKHGRVGLTNKEIEFISDRVGVGIPSGNIASAFRAAKTPGYANKSTQDHTIRITGAGATYLKTAGEKAEA